MRQWLPLLLVVLAVAGCQSTAGQDGIVRTNEPSPSELTAFGDTFKGLQTIAPVEYYASDQAVAEAKNQFRSENYGNAGALFYKAVQLAPNDGVAWLGLAASCDRIRRFDLSDKAYRQAYPLCRRDARILQQSRLFLPAARQAAGRPQELPQGV
jgi:Flp pilus assembly protein TadD